MLISLLGFNHRCCNQKWIVHSSIKIFINQYLFYSSATLKFICVTSQLPDAILKFICVTSHAPCYHMYVCTLLKELKHVNPILE
jgi:hypothetical protein